MLGAEAIELTDVAFPAALFIGGDDEIVLATRFEADRRRADDPLARARQRRLGVARLGIHFPSLGSGDPVACAGRSFAILFADVSPVDVAAFYAAARDAGYGWGPQFQGLAEITRVSGAARGVICAAGWRRRASRSSCSIRVFSIPRCNSCWRAARARVARCDADRDRAGGCDGTGRGKAVAVGRTRTSQRHLTLRSRLGRREGVPSRGSKD